MSELEQLRQQLAAANAIIEGEQDRAKEREIEYHEQRRLREDAEAELERVRQLPDKWRYESGSMDPYADHAVVECALELEAALASPSAAAVQSVERWALIEPDGELRSVFKDRDQAQQLASTFNRMAQDHGKPTGFHLRRVSITTAQPAPVAQSQEGE